MRMAKDVEKELRGTLIQRSGGGSRLGRGFKESDQSSGVKGSNGSQFGSSVRNRPRSGWNAINNKGYFGLGLTNHSQGKSGQNGSNMQASSMASTGVTRSEKEDAGRGNSYCNKGIRHLPYSELMDRKAKGLCFRCGEKFHPLHQCAKKQFCLVVLGDDETVNAAGEIIAIEIQEEEDEAIVECNALGMLELTEIVLAVKQPTTMRLEGKLMGADIMFWWIVVQVTILLLLRLTQR